jgi:phage terminase large subunit-like protein
MARLVVAESNQGGEMVKEVLDVSGEGAVRVKLEHASMGKRDRAEPVPAIHGQRRVWHVGVMKELEDQMCSFGAAGGEPRSRSPDRVDALVWAVGELLRKPPAKVGVEVLRRSSAQRMDV